MTLRSKEQEWMNCLIWGGQAANQFAMENNCESGADEKLGWKSAGLGNDRTLNRLSFILQISGMLKGLFATKMQHIQHRV